ncbi:glycosyltransferase family 9 protein [Ekhidna sp.]
MKILIIHTVSRDEALFVGPVLRALKSELDAEVHLAVNTNIATLFRNSPYIDGIHNSQTTLIKLRKALKKEGFDYIVDLQNSWKSKIVRIDMAKKYLVFKPKRFYKWFFIKTKINRLPKSHLIDQYFELLKNLNVKGDSLGLDFFLDEKDVVENDWLPKSHQSGYATIALSATHNTKKLPVNRLIELCDRINKPIILIGEEKDNDLANEIETFFKRGTEEEEEAIEGLNKKTTIFNACGKFSFNQSASIVKNAQWVFTYDNLMMHVAAAFKKRLYTIWGSSTPFFGTYPYRTQFTVFENNGLPCRPCSGSGFTNCPKGHFKCMNDLNFDFYLPD